jgi:hypothetical protein
VQRHGGLPIRANGLLHCHSCAFLTPEKQATSTCMIPRSRFRGTHSSQRLLRKAHGLGLSSAGQRQCSGHKCGPHSLAQIRQHSANWNVLKKSRARTGRRSG